MEIKYFQETLYDIFIIMKEKDKKLFKYLICKFFIDIICSFEYNKFINTIYLLLWNLAFKNKSET